MERGHLVLYGRLRGGLEGRINCLLRAMESRTHFLQWKAIMPSAHLQQVVSRSHECEPWGVAPPIGLRLRRLKHLMGRLDGHPVGVQRNDLGKVGRLFQPENRMSYFSDALHQWPLGLRPYKASDQGGGDGQIVPFRRSIASADRHLRYGEW